MRVHPESSKVTVDDGIELACVVNGLRHDYTIEWRFINCKQQSSSLLTHSLVLNISGVQLNDSGSYECIVRNGSGIPYSSTPGILQVVGNGT